MTIALAAGRFFGDTVGIEIAGAILSEVRHDLGRTVPDHTHACAYFTLLVEGSYTETCGDTTVVYDPFTVVFHARRMQHTDTIGPSGGRFFTVELGERWTNVVAAVRDNIVELRGGEPAWLMSRLYQEFLTRDAASPLTIESLLYELCASVGELAALPPEAPAWLGTVDAVVERTFTEPFSLQRLADDAGVHPSHLCRTFHRFRGRTIGDVVLGMRLQLACRGVVETDRALADVAADAGFTDASHMTHVFKRVLGTTPGTYRRAMRVSPPTGDAPDAQTGGSSRCIP